MTTVLVTGGAGFIGSNACNAFSSKGYRVIALDNLSLGRANNLDPSVSFVRGSASDMDTLKSLGKIDVIIHLAGSSSAPMFTTSLQECFVNNISSHIAVLEFARQSAVRKVLFASTSSLYGNTSLPLVEKQSTIPTNFYAVSKHSQEELSHAFHKTYGVEIIGFRFMSVYGLYEEHKGRFANLVSQFIWGIEQGKNPVIYGDGSQTCDFVHVSDIISAFDLTIQNPKNLGFAVMNVGTARATTLNELVNVINTIMGKQIPPVYKENPIKEGYIYAQKADLSYIQEELGYSAGVALQDGVKEIVEYRKRNPVAPASLSY